MKRTILSGTGLVLYLTACTANTGQPTNSAGDSDGEAAYSETALTATDWIVTMKNKKSGRCAGVDQGSKAIGASIKQFTCDGSKNQRWIRMDQKFGNLSLKNSNSGLCIGVDGGSKQPGAPLQQFECDGKPNQTWSLETSGEELSAHLHRVDTKLCIGVDNASVANGAQLKQFTCNFEEPNQGWDGLE